MRIPFWNRFAGKYSSMYMHIAQNVLVIIIGSPG